MVEGTATGGELDQFVRAVLSVADAARRVKVWLFSGEGNAVVVRGSARPGPFRGVGTFNGVRADDVEPTGSVRPARRPSGTRNMCRPSRRPSYPHRSHRRRK